MITDTTHDCLPSSQIADPRGIPASSRVALLVGPDQEVEARTVRLEPTFAVRQERWLVNQPEFDNVVIVDVVSVASGYRMGVDLG